jgi:hypothetical protein
MHANTKLIAVGHLFFCEGMLQLQQDSETFRSMTDFEHLNVLN